MNRFDDCHVCGESTILASDYARRSLADVLDGTPAGTSRKRVMEALIDQISGHYAFEQSPRAAAGYLGAKRKHLQRGGILPM